MAGKKQCNYSAGKVVILQHSISYEIKLHPIGIGLAYNKCVRRYILQQVAVQKEQYQVLRMSVIQVTRFISWGEI
jgi:hypothetical protein